LKNSIILAFDFAKRDFKERYVGTGLGQMWYILSPLITIFIYTVIFSDFMKMKLNIIDNSYAYSIYLIPGLLAWNAMSTILLRMDNVIFEKVNLIKKISVPVYTFYLSVIITETALFFLSLSFGVIFLLLVDQTVNFVFLWLIPLILIQSVFILGLGVIVSLFSAFFRDLKEALPIVLQLLFWMTPIIYMKEMISDKYPFLVTYNPFYYFIKLYQNIFVYTQAPTCEDLCIIIAIAFVTLFLAMFLYKKMISTIKDII